MEAVSARPYRPLRTLHAIFLAFAFPMFLGALISDWAYWTSYEIQWSNFSQWLIVGGLVGGGFALLWSVVDLLRNSFMRHGRPLIYFLTLLAAWVLGFINALVHSKDAWATMPAGLWLSIVATILALAATWIGFSNRSAGAVT